MKRIYIPTLILSLQSYTASIAQDIITYLDIHLSDGTVIQYEDKQVSHVSFHQIDMSDPAVIDSLAKLKQRDYNADSLWINKGISGGIYFTTNTRISTKTYIPEEVDYILLNKDYHIYLHAYEDNVFKGAFSNGQFITSGKAYALSNIINLKAIKEGYPEYRYKISLYKKNGNDEICISESCNLKMFNSIYYYNVYLPAERAKNPEPILSFIDDDGFAEAAKNWEIIYDSCGLRPSMALITKNVNSSNSQISWQTIERLKHLGFEFISHTHSHRNITTLTRTELIEDLQTSINILNEHECNSDFLVYPGNKHNESTDTIVSSMFKGAFWQGDRINILPLNTTSINRYSILDATHKIETMDAKGNIQNVYPAKSDAELQSIIDEAVDRGGWVVFMCHFYNNYSYGYHCDEEMRSTVIKLVRYAQSKGVKIMPVGDAYENFKYPSNMAK